MALTRFGSALAAAFVALTISACAGRDAVPQPLAATGYALRTIAVERTLPATAKSLCDLKGTWYFRGPCVKIDVKPAGSSARFATLDGLSASLGTGKNDAEGVQPFLFALGTGRQNITGTNDGKRFPFMGSHCVELTPSGAATIVTCPKPLAYFEMLNDTAAASDDVYFESYPSLVISKNGTFPGTTCNLAMLVTDPQNGVLYWNILPISGTVSKHTLAIRPTSTHQGIDIAGGHLVLFAVGCK